MQSVLFNNVRISSFCNIHQPVLLPERLVGAALPAHQVIVDRACEIPEGLVVGENPSSTRSALSAPRTASCLITKLLARL